MPRSGTGGLDREMRALHPVPHAEPEGPAALTVKCAPCTPYLTPSPLRPATVTVELAPRGSPDLL
jgi:hypothetical protein